MYQTSKVGGDNTLICDVSSLRSVMVPVVDRLLAGINGDLAERQSAFIFYQEE